MIAQYIDNVFDDSYLPTISDNKSKFLTFRGQNYEIQILDTAGQVKKQMSQEEEKKNDAIALKSTRLIFFSFSFFRLN